MSITPITLMLVFIVAAFVFALHGTTMNERKKTQENS
jgi:hypothetical protein